MVAINSRSDPNDTKIVLARSPRKEELVKLGVSPTTVRAMLDGKLNAKLGEFCGLVHGNVWGSQPKGSDPQEGTPGLTRPIAIYQGLKRPMVDVGLDERVYTYVTNPNVNYDFPQERQLSGQGPKRVDVPVHAVFTTYADFSDRAVDELRASVGYPSWPQDLAGVVLYWAWTRASKKSPGLPFDHDQRYEERVWYEPHS